MQCCSCVKPHLIRITLKLKLNLKLRKTETFRSIVRIFGRCVISLNSTFDCGVVFILWKLLRWTIIENRKRLLAAAAAFVSFVINPPLNGGGGKLSYCTCIKMSWDFAWGGKKKLTTNTIQCLLYKCTTRNWNGENIVFAIRLRRNIVFCLIIFLCVVKKSEYEPTSKSDSNEMSKYCNFIRNNVEKIYCD